MDSGKKIWEMEKPANVFIIMRDITLEIGKKIKGMDLESIFINIMRRGTLANGDMTRSMERAFWYVMGQQIPLAGVQDKTILKECSKKIRNMEGVF